MDKKDKANAREAIKNTILVHESQSFDEIRSQLWKNFVRFGRDETGDGKERALCKHCKSIHFDSESHNGTANMRKHLQECVILRCSKAEAEGNIYDTDVYRELVAKAIIKHGYSFSWVEHEGNRSIHAYLNNQVKSICRNTAEADCLKLHESLKAQLKETLRNVPGHISLTCGIWTSCQTEDYLCLTVHYVDANWKLNSKVLNFYHLNPLHTGKAMYQVVLSLLQEWGIDDKILTVTLDNTCSDSKMQDYLKATLKRHGALLCHGDFFHVRCAAHVLDHIVEDALKVIDHIVVKIRDCVKCIKWSEERKFAFRYCVNLAKIKESKSLWLDVPTRWNSTYKMLDRAILYREAFLEMTELQSCPNSKEWEVLEKIRDVLEPLHDITELFAGRHYPTSNLYFGNVWKIHMLLLELTHSNDEILRAMSQEMKCKLDKYWFNSEEDNYVMLFSFAMILDPRCKLSVLKFCYEQLYGDVEAALKITKLKLKLEKFYKEYVPIDTTLTPNITVRMPSGNQKRKFDYFAMYDEAIKSSNGRSQLDVYLEDAKLNPAAELDILQFWKESEHRYGRLSHFARDILSVPITTVASESSFSIGGRILNKWRSFYLPENAGALITSRSWLFGHESYEDDEFVGCYVDWATTKS